MTPSTTAMRDRAAGELVIEHLLETQAESPPRSGIARLLGRSPLGEDSLSWYVGALGEIAVGRLLAELPTGWTSFHAVPVGTKGADIDHLVVGPGGLFTLNTQHHRGKAVWVAGSVFQVSGQNQAFLRGALDEADRVARILRERLTLLTPVQPMIVLVDPKTLRIETAPDRVSVVDARYLVTWLGTRPVILTSPDVDAIVAVVDDPATWRPGLVPTPGLMVRFEALDREVRSARTRRRAWGAGLAGAAIVAWFALAQVLPPMVSGAVAGFMP